MTLNHNVQALVAGQFVTCGKILALGLLYGSEAPNCFCREVVDFIVYGAVKDPEHQYMIISIPDDEIRGKLVEVSILIINI